LKAFLTRNRFLPFYSRQLSLGAAPMLAIGGGWDGGNGEAIGMGKTSDGVVGTERTSHTFSSYAGLM
jgi:hypothetical protein